MVTALGATALLGVLFLDSAAGKSESASANYELVIRGGRIVDGTGNPWFAGDVAVEADRIVAVGRISAGAGRRELDAKGFIVAPGFFDMHSHSDWVLLEDGCAQSKIRQGVTTEVLGEGFSAGPWCEKLAPRRVEVLGKSTTIGTLAEYFRVVEQAGVSVNVVSYAGIGNVWEAVMGQSHARPTREQVGEMKTLLAAAMMDGAFGLSSQVMMPPGSLATTDEIVDLCGVVREFGGIYATHIRNEGLGVFDSVKEAIEIGERAGVPVDILHLKIADQTFWGRMNEVIELINDARRRSVDVQANIYPYTRGNNDLSSIIPPWAHEGGNARMLDRLRNATDGKKMKRDIREGIPGWYNHFTAVGGDWSRMLVNGNLSAKNKQFEGMTMDKVIERKSLDKDLEDLQVLFNFLIEEGGSVSTIFAHHTEADMNLALSQPWCSIGSDGSALATAGPLRRGNPHPRSFGTFPRVLGVYVRENGLLRLEDAVRKMTSLSAAKLGIFDRGVIRPGSFADLTIFDPHRVIDHATYADPFHYSAGIECVIVNGQIVLDRGNHTGVRSGRVLRHVAADARGDAH